MPNDPDAETEAPPWQSIGGILKTLRESAGKSQDEIAQAAQVSRVTLAKYEEGYVTKLDELKRITDALGLGLDVRVGAGLEEAHDILAYTVEREAAKREQQASHEIIRYGRLLEEVNKQKNIRAELEQDFVAGDFVKQVQAAIDDVQKQKTHPFQKVLPLLLTIAKESREAHRKLTPEEQAGHRDEFFDGLLYVFSKSGIPVEALAALMVFDMMTPKVRRRTLGKLLKEGIDGGWLPATEKELYPRP